MTKAQTETHNVNGLNLEEPNFENGKSLLMAGLRRHYTTESWDEIPAQWQSFRTYLGNIAGQVGRVTYGACFQSSSGFDYLTGVEISENAELPGEFVQATIPPQKYVVFTHRDHVSKMRETLEAMEQYMRSSGLDGWKQAGIRLASLNDTNISTLTLGSVR